MDEIIKNVVSHNYYDNLQGNCEVEFSVLSLDEKYKFNTEFIDVEMEIGESGKIYVVNTHTDWKPSKYKEYYPPEAAPTPVGFWRKKHLKSK